VQTLFAFAKAQRYLPKDHDEIDSVMLAKENVNEIEIFTPKEMAEILTHADKRLIPFLTLRAFAGVRHAEIQRLEWKDIHFDAGIIEIRAAKAKTASRRTVPILKNLRACSIAASPA
jgi:integrase